MGLHLSLFGGRLRAHQCGHRRLLYPRSSGLLWRQRWAEKNAIGRTRGGITTKIHAATDKCGKPLFLTISRGTVNDVQVGPFLLKRLPARHCIADRAYDSRPFRAWLRQRSIKPVIPSTLARKIPFPLDRRLYQQRYEVERFFHRLKVNRRIATRYEKRAISFLSMLQVACFAILAL